VSHAAIVSLFLHYLLLPVVALLLGVVLYLRNHRRHLLDFRHFAGLLVFTVPMGLLGLLGLLDLWFMPFYYLLVLVLALLGGVYYLRQLGRALGEDQHHEQGFVYVLTAFVLTLGGALFCIVFTLCSELNYGLWATTCLLSFVVPLLFLRAYEAMLAIPSEIRQVWYYPLNSPEIELDHIDYYRLKILTVELHKRPGRGEPPIKIKARTPPELPFGQWFQKFIDDYNYKFPNSPIQVADDQLIPYGWLFYAVQPSLFRLQLRRYIDADLSIAHNRLDERYVIVAKRVEEA
jgi:hypothetical protein